MTKPRTAISEIEAAAIWAVLTQPRPTVRSVAAAIGRSIEATHRHLSRLKRQGLVRWEPGKDGTLRSGLELSPRFSPRWSAEPGLCSPSTDTEATPI